MATNPNPVTTGSLAVQATTGAAGFALTAGGGTVLTWNVPNDGNLHRMQVFGSLVVGGGSAETGGAVSVNYSVPVVGGTSHTVFAGSQAASVILPAGAFPVTVAPGTTVTLTQAALTVGTAQMYAEIWGS